MDPAKVKAIVEWKPPTSVSGVRSFLGFANFYQRFIPSFARLARPLTDMTRQNIRFSWTPEAEQSFRHLKDAFIQAPVLMQFDCNRRTAVETDSSVYVVGALLTQFHEHGDRRPCAFFSKKNTPEECNYPICDKELLVIIKSLKEWESHLQGVDSFEIWTDHKNLTYFNTIRRLS